jgi:hypothetical protein
VPQIAHAVHAWSANLPERLFDRCNKFGFEGVVSKRLASCYSSGPSRNWIKTKWPGWKRINSERYRLFEAPRKPELTEAQMTLAKKRAELARVIKRLRSPPLSHGIARELRKHAAISEREIAELERVWWIFPNPIRLSNLRGPGCLRQPIWISPVEDVGL